jgi:hypothetical protein
VENTSIERAKVLALLGKGMRIHCSSSRMICIKEIDGSSVSEECSIELFDLLRGENLIMNRSFSSGSGWSCCCAGNQPEIYVISEKGKSVLSGNL